MLVLAALPGAGIVMVTPLGLLNFVALQWFGVRLGRVIYDRREVTVNFYTTRIVERKGWTLLRWVWPLTGWWSDYRWIARRRR